jgi:hypothetical protein
MQYPAPVTNKFKDAAETALHRREIKAAGVCMRVETIHTFSDVI